MAIGTTYKNLAALRKGVQDRSYFFTASSMRMFGTVWRPEEPIRYTPGDASGRGFFAIENSESPEPFVVYSVQETENGPEFTPVGYYESMEDARKFTLFVAGAVA